MYMNNSVSQIAQLNERLLKLDKYQKDIVYTDSNMIVYAGAGCGKTFTILSKIFYLISNNVLPEEILIISFTNNSVNDIQEKLNNLPIKVLTFHKLAMQTLKNSGTQFNICSQGLLKYTIEENLKTCTLKTQKIILKYLGYKKSYKNFLFSQEFQSFVKMIESYINIFKANGISLKNVSNVKYTKLEKNIVALIFKIYHEYMNEKLSTNSFDFDDLIMYSAEILYSSTKKTNVNYKYIFVDEFQDSSSIRLKLLKAIFLLTSAKIIVVGDDFQSIYRFSGCDLNIFLDFKNFFPNVSEKYIVKTYRNAQQLVNIASEFVMKNPLQIKKSIVSDKNITTPYVFAPASSKINTLIKILDYLLPQSKNIMVLTRNNNDIYEYISSVIKYENGEILYKEQRICHFTVHKSKGLEADYVIVLNCDDTTLGFPNKIEDNILIQKLFPNSEIPFAEERRLFYVAITRCKIKTFFVYDKSNPSKFIQELKWITFKKTHKIPIFKNY